MKFNAEKVRDQVVQWTRDWFEVNGRDCNAVLGISGGKDSTIAAAVCVAALGKERVVGIRMPNGVQHDIDVSRAVTQFLGIRSYEINIKGAYDATMEALMGSMGEISNQTIVNLPPRLRMATLYAASQSLNGRVVNTSNLSEDWVGYATRYGDTAGDFSPLSKLTVQEVKAVGRALGLPEEFIEKPPIDGLCGKTDEDNLGFTYAALDRYIRTGVCEDAEAKAKIDRLHKINLFKLAPLPVYELPEEDFSIYED